MLYLLKGLWYIHTYNIGVYRYSKNVIFDIKWSKSTWWFPNHYLVRVIYHSTQDKISWVDCVYTIGYIIDPKYQGHASSAWGFNISSIDDFYISTISIADISHFHPKPFQRLAQGTPIKEGSKSYNNNFILYPPPFSFRIQQGTGNMIGKNKLNTKESCPKKDTPWGSFVLRYYYITTW